MQRNERDAMFFHHHQNSMNKQAQFSFAADVFLLQAILFHEDKANKNISYQLEYLFTWTCYKQIIEWLLKNGPSVVGSEFMGVQAIHTSATHVRVLFPNDEEQDKMHLFFEKFNMKRKQAQGIDLTFPPMPDIYQGQSTPNIESIKRYILSIEKAFDGNSNEVEIPIGSSQKFYSFIL